MDSNKITVNPIYLFVLFLAILATLFIATSHHRVANDIMTNSKVWSATPEAPCGQYKTCIGVTVETVNNETGKLESRTYRYNAAAEGLMDRDVRNAIISQMSDNFSNWNTSVISAKWSDEE